VPFVKFVVKKNLNPKNPHRSKQRISQSAILTPTFDLQGDQVKEISSHKRHKNSQKDVLTGSIIPFE